MTYQEKARFLHTRDAGRGAGEKQLIARVVQCFEQNPDFAPDYNTKVLLDAVLAWYEKKYGRAVA